MLENNETTKTYIACFMEKMTGFGFDQEEAIIMLVNAGEKLSPDNIMKAVDYIEPPESGVVRSDIDKNIAEVEINKILGGGKQ